MEHLSEALWSLSLKKNTELSKEDNEMLQEAAIKLQAFERMEAAMLACKQRMRAFNKNERTIKNVR